MIKSKKQMFTIIGVFILIMMLGTITYAFFNYTRTGLTNNIKVGRIAFNSNQNTINLTNVFPINSNEVASDNDNVGVATIHITGDTTYSGGIEYLVSAENINNTINNKKVPISVSVSYAASENATIGESDKEYFAHRGNNTSIYKVLAGKKIANGNNLLVGYIKPNATGIDGTITIKAYIDKNNVAITDTYIKKSEAIVNPNMTETAMNYCISYFNNYSFDQNGSSTDFCSGTGTYRNMTFQEAINSYFADYIITSLKNNDVVVEIATNDTTREWVNGRTVLTTNEWNSLSENGISFQVKVEANEGIWVKVMQ